MLERRGGGGEGPFCQCERFHPLNVSAFWAREPGWFRKRPETPLIWLAGHNRCMYDTPRSFLRLTFVRDS